MPQVQPGDLPFVGVVPSPRDDLADVRPTVGLRGSPSPGIAVRRLPVFNASLARRLPRLANHQPQRFVRTAVVRPACGEREVDPLVAVREPTSVDQRGVLDELHSIAGRIVGIAVVVARRWQQHACGVGLDSEVVELVEVVDTILVGFDDEAPPHAARIVALAVVRPRHPQHSRSVPYVVRTSSDRLRDTLADRRPHAERHGIVDSPIRVQPPA